MKQLSTFYIALLFFFSAFVAQAQQVHKGQIDVRDSEMKRVGDSLQVKMAIDTKNLKLSTNRYLTLTPQITDDKNSVELGDVLLNGRTRSKSYKRSMALDKSQLDEYQPNIVARSNNKEVLYFSKTVAYEPWMQNAHLNMKQVLCGCGGHNEEVAETRLTGQPPLPLIYNVIPQYAYIQPEVETVKSRGDQFELYLNFPVNKTNILPDYMDNSSELTRLYEALNKIKSDKHLDVQKINIVGYASPEGTVANNEKLSKGRAEALKTYLVSKSKTPASTYAVKYGGENWSGLIEAIEKSDKSDKLEILYILQNTEDATARKNKLKAYKKGVTYNSMLKEIYPRLRKVILDVQYNVQNFTVEEAKEIMKTRPQLLSSAEMYAVANTYTAGSVEYINAMETAAKVFPKDESASLNAAAIALSKNDLPLAESYLKKTSTTTGEYVNNMGILHLLKGDLQKAKTEFEKASQLGVSAAKYNLQEVSKKYDIEVLNKQK